MRLSRWLIGISLVSYLVLIVPLSTHLRERPTQIKLGYLPEATVLKMVSADQRYALADMTIFKVLFYFGHLMEEAPEDQLFYSDPDYTGMFHALDTAIQLEPYNIDSYYFVQAVFPWKGEVEEANRLLEYGMQHRPWDFYLPFFLAFNNAFFLQNYEEAARHMQKAADLLDSDMFRRLASRYLHEAGQTEFAIIYLKTMIESAKDPNERKLYETRRNALLVVAKLQEAVAGYQESFGRLPENMQALVEVGLLEAIPEDPYGGSYYLDSDGRVRTTSKMAFADRPASESAQEEKQ